MRANTLLFGFALLALTFAGCTGDFNVRQTEPIKVQVDGEGEMTRLAAGGDDGEARESEFRIENPDDVEVVTVVVQVVKVEAEDADEPGDVDEGDDDETNETEDDDANESDDGAEPTVILIIIEDRETGERLDEQRVEATDDGAQAELNVNVKGKDNIVVVTQAVQGTADVTVSAKEGSEQGPGDMEEEDDAENNTTMPRYQTRYGSSPPLNPSSLAATRSPYSSWIGCVVGAVFAEILWASAAASRGSVTVASPSTVT